MKVTDAHCYLVDMLNYLDLLIKITKSDNR